MRITLPIVGVTPALFLALLVVPASADVVQYGWVDDATFNYKLSHMPDFDQKRAGTLFGDGGLPNQGKYYCVPTAIMNLFAYAANHGFPELDPGEGSWQLQGQYWNASLNISQLGELMDTDPFDGTGYGDAVEGASDWLDEHGGGRFVFQHASRTGTWAPKINNLAHQTAFGGIVAFCYGRYNIAGASDDTVIIGERDSGHCVTMTEAMRLDDVMSLKSRDPATGGDWYEQSQWKNKSYATKNLTVINFSAPSSYTMTSLDFDPQADRVRLIDTMFILRPKNIYSWESSNRFTINMPSTLDSVFPRLSELTLGLLPGAVIVDTSELLGTGLIGVTSQVGGNGSLGLASLTDGSYTSIASVPTGSRLVAGRHGSLYVMCGERIECYNPDLANPFVATLSLDQFSSDIAYDDATDTLVVWSSEAGLLTLAPHTLASMSTYSIATPSVPDGRVQVGPDGTLFLTGSPVNDRIFRVDVSSGDPVVTTIAHPDLNGFTDFDLDDDGRLFACVEGALREFVQNPVSGVWTRATQSPSGLDGLPCAGQVSVVRCRSNFDPATMSGPGWRDIDADLVDAGTEVADCPGDFVPDQVVDAQDFLRLLAEWGSCVAGCDADANQDGAVEALDLLAMLAHWGPCD